MKILLQSTRTLKFISDREPASEGHWTTEQATARIFTTALDALYHCYRRGIADMQILVVFADSRQNVSVPVTDSQIA